MLERFRKAFSVLTTNKNLQFDAQSGTWTPWGSDFTHHSQVIHGWTYIALEAIASEVSRSHLVLKKKRTDAEVERHPIIDVLNMPNKFQPGAEFLYYVQLRLDAYGNALIMKDRDRQPKNLKPLSNDEFQIEFDKDNEIVKYRRIQGENLGVFTQEDVLHLKYPGDVIYEGKGKLDYLHEWLTTLNLSQNYVNQILRKGPFFNGVMETPAEDPEQMKQIKESFYQKYANPHTAGEIAFLPKDTKYTDMDASLENIQYSEFDKQIRDKVLAGFRVPKSIVGISETGDSHSDQENAYRNFLRLTIVPKLEYLVNYLNAFFVPLYDNNVYLDFIDPTPEDREMKLKERSEGVHKWIPVNKILREEGEPPVEGGDKLYKPRGLTEIGEVQEEEQTQTNSLAGDFLQTFEKSLQTRKSQNEDIVREFWNSLTEEQAAQRRADLVEESKFLQRNTENEEELADAVQNVYDQFREIAISEIPTNLEERAYQKDLEDSLQDAGLTQELINAITPILNQIARTEGVASLEGLDTVTEFQFTKDLEDVINRIAKEGSESHVKTMTSRLIREFNEGLEEGDSREEMIGRIDDIFVNRERAEQFARTTRFQAANQAKRESYKQSDVVKTVKYHTAEDDLVCPFCRPRNGQIVDVNEPFFNQGDQVWNEDQTDRLEVITAGGEPPLHPACRCLILPDQIEV